jgi:tetratricopeptide (TPR) repeat protein
MTDSLIRFTRGGPLSLEITFSRGASGRGHKPGGGGLGCRLAAWLAAVLAANCLNASAGEREAAVFARTNFQAAAVRYQADANNAEAAWRFARACFDLADIATNHTEKASVAEQGIAACRQLIARAPDLVPAHYYLGMDLGELAQTKGLGALRLVKQMEREFTMVREQDEKFDYAGADRNLGLLYRDAPAFGSIGSRTKAKQCLERAVALAPNYPENRLDLLEAYLKSGDDEPAQRELQTLDALWPRARTNFTGPAWAASWDDWEPRLKKARAKINH